MSSSFLSNVIQRYQCHSCLWSRLGAWWMSSASCRASTSWGCPVCSRCAWSTWSLSHEQSSQGLASPLGLWWLIWCLLSLGKGLQSSRVPHPFLHLALWSRRMWCGHGPHLYDEYAGRQRTCWVKARRSRFLGWSRARASTPFSWDDSFIGLPNGQYSRYPQFCGSTP